MDLTCLLVISTWIQLPPARPFTPVRGLPDPESGRQLVWEAGGGCEEEEMREEAERKREEDKESYILPELKIFLNFSITELMFLHYATFTMSQLFASGDQNTGASALASVLPKYLGLIFFKIDWFDLLAAKGLSRIFSSTTIQRHQFFGTLPSLWSSSCNHTWPMESLDYTDLCRQSDVFAFQHTV